jgi:PPOX class probable F420-dependent enzyme
MLFIQHCYIWNLLRLLDEWGQINNCPKKGGIFIMDVEAIQAILAKPNEAIIATNRPGKGSQLSPVWFVWDGDVFLFTTPKATAKYANIARDPNISLIVNDTTAHVCVSAYGRAEIVGVERYPELVNALVERYMPAAMRERAAAGIQARAERVVIVFKPEKMIGWSASVAS